MLLAYHTELPDPATLDEVMLHVVDTDLENRIFTARVNAPKAKKVAADLDDFVGDLSGHGCGLFVCNVFRNETVDAVLAELINKQPIYVTVVRKSIF